MISQKNSALIFDPKICVKKYINRPESYVSIKKNMKYSATLPMFLIWRENLLSFDNIRVFFFRTLRRSKDVIFHEKIFTKFYLTCLENNLFNF